MFDKVIAITDRKICERPFLSQIEIVCKHHPKALVLREKDMMEEDYYLLAMDVYEICDKYGVRLIIHNFPQAAGRLYSLKQNSQSVYNLIL